MVETFDHPNFRIVDDLLDEETWTEVWSDFQFTELHPVTRTLGAWKLDDGVPLGGAEAIVARADTATAEAGVLQRLIHAVIAETAYYQGMVADDWDRVSARPYVYPQETGLAWHVDDSALYAGAFIYYAHPEWNAHWGGELFVAERDRERDEELGEMPIMGHRFETDEYSERLMEMGVGNFIMPKPNRLVVLGSAPHMVAPVRRAAGDKVRASVAGFFLRPEQ